MQWEYKVVRVPFLLLKEIEAGRTRSPVDAEGPNWGYEAFAVRVPQLPAGYADEMRVPVAWSDRGCWTTLPKCLAELGEQEWELVGSTPQWEAAGAPFDLLLKRPKTE